MSPIWKYGWVNIKNYSAPSNGEKRDYNNSKNILNKTMFLLGATKKGFSSKEIQRQLELKRYEPVWAMVHKLRKAMGDREDRYTLKV